MPGGSLPPFVPAHPESRQYSTTARGSYLEQEEQVFNTLPTIDIVYSNCLLSLQCISVLAIYYDRHYAKTVELGRISLDSITCKTQVVGCMTY